MVHTSEASGQFFMQAEFDVDVFHLRSMCCQDYICHFFLVMHLNAGLSVVSKCITCASFRGTHARQVDWILPYVKLVRSDVLIKRVPPCWKQYMPSHNNKTQSTLCASFAVLLTLQLHVYKHHEAPAKPSHKKQGDMHAVDDQAVKHPKVQAPVT